MILSITTLPVCLANGPAYVIGSIPPQQIAQGSMLRLQLHTPPHHGVPTFRYTIDPGYPSPQGALHLDAFSGQFTYTPDPDDTFEFHLTFTSVVPGHPPEVQAVVITPVTPLPPESAVIQRTTATPDPPSTDYLVVTQAENNAQEIFNGTQRSTWNVAQ